MKKNIIISILILLIFLITGFFIYFLSVDKREVMDREIIKLSNDIKDLKNYFNRYDFKSTGVMELEANYKGAHGESFPHTFLYNLAIEDDYIYFENEEGYNTFKVDDILTIIKTFDKLSLSTFKVDNIKIKKREIKGTIDVGNINKIYDTSFKNGEITLNISNIFSKRINKTTIKLDDMSLTIEDNKYSINYADKFLKITINKDGYSLNYNEIVKVNAFFGAERDNYNILIKGYVFALGISGYSLDFTANTPASIYNSLKGSISFKDNKIEKKNKLDDIKNPLIRYFSSIEM